MNPTTNPTNTNTVPPAETLTVEFKSDRKRLSLRRLAASQKIELRGAGRGAAYVEFAGAAQT